MERTVNTDLAAYVKDADTALKARYGVRYMDVYKELHGDLNEVKKAMATGTSAAEFANKAGEAAGFTKVTEMAPEVCGAINLRKAALDAFRRDNAGWYPGRDGAIYMAGDDGELVRMRAVEDNSGSKIGFGVEVARDTEMTLADDDRVVVEDGVEFELVSRGIDMSDAIAKFNQTYDPAATAGMRI